ncbi:MAG TPA: branched-chain-amino-acid transaminase [Phycisphaerae bacterium]|jgi:branched-chain amino acid aminotransferase|nr:branched-chain-amino-acid transaminase [Phycisphaerae bacterium]HRT41062.1 branched-chain-amino-acid transaminase [Phycisphaerae bacterium]
METATAPQNFDPDPNLKVWLNGNLITAADAKLSIFEHGLLYGDGIFEGLRSYNGRVFDAAGHLRRFFDSAKAIMLDLPYQPEDIEQAFTTTLDANGLGTPDKDAYLRLVATRGVGMLGMSPTRAGRPNVFVIATPLGIYRREVYEQGMRAIVASVVRNLPNSMPPRIKSLNYLNNILAKIESHQAGVDEAIMLNHLGYIAEATADNVFVVRNGQLQTPPTSAGILEGITRGHVIRLARETGIEVVEKNLERVDLYTADEAFLTGTAAEIVPLIEVDRRKIGAGVPGSMTKELMAAYHKMVRGG